MVYYDNLWKPIVNDLLTMNTTTLINRYYFILTCKHDKPLLIYTKL